jgi:hypothetical protein
VICGGAGVAKQALKAEQKVDLPNSDAKILPIQGGADRIWSPMRGVINYDIPM